MPQSYVLATGAQASRLPSIRCEAHRGRSAVPVKLQFNQAVRHLASLEWASGTPSTPVAKTYDWPITHQCQKDWHHIICSLYWLHLNYYDKSCEPEVSGKLIDKISFARCVSMADFLCPTSISLIGTTLIIKQFLCFTCLPKQEWDNLFY